VRARSFSHVGITVSDFNRAVRFYWEIFGCPLVGVADTPPERVRAFFGVQAQEPRCRIGWVRVPGGGILEIFEFRPGLAPEAIAWNRIGLTHFSFNVRNVHRWYEYLSSRGVECVSRPEQSPRGHWFFFVKDFDGNLIELIDLRKMHHVLRWLGPVGGWLFRKRMYKRYYEPPQPERPGMHLPPDRERRHHEVRSGTTPHV
jgi:catechol 2,3-dioxygenase-like lactoylglutathione lyase family enzyme